jgi:hypothetical protein
MNFITDTIDLEALLYALAQQPDSLPPALQASLTEIGRDLETNPSEEKAIELRELIKSDELLELAYQNGLVAIDRAYNAQERTKGMGATFPSRLELEDLDFSAILTSHNWVNAAKQAIYIKTSSPARRSQFLLRGDRVVTLASGGAFLGVLIFQIPGAIIGGLLAGIYAWWSFPTAKADGNN